MSDPERGLGSLEANGLRAISEFFQELSRSVERQAPLDMKQIVSHAARIGVGASDLLMGVLQPMLYQIGDWYACGKITVAQEHEFSSIVERLIGELEKNPQVQNAPPRHFDVVLGCVEGNQHYFGVRFLEFALREAEFSVHSVFPHVPLSELFGFASAVEAKVVGISVTLEEHLRPLQNIQHVLSNMNGYEPLVIVGGLAIRAGAPQLPGAHYFSGSMNDLITLIRRRVGSA